MATRLCLNYSFKEGDTCFVPSLYVRDSVLKKCGGDGCYHAKLFKCTVLYNCFVYNVSFGELETFILCKDTMCGSIIAVPQRHVINERLCKTVNDFIDYLSDEHLSESELNKILLKFISHISAYRCVESCRNVSIDSSYKVDFEALPSEFHVLKPEGESSVKVSVDRIFGVAVKKGVKVRTLGIVKFDAGKQDQHNAVSNLILYSNQAPLKDDILTKSAILDSVVALKEDRVDFNFIDIGKMCLRIAEGSKEYVQI